MGEVDPITHMVDVVWEDSIYCVESSILLIVLSKIYLFESIQYPFQRKRIGTVSYTHLTLPTKRIV